MRQPTRYVTYSGTEVKVGDVLWLERHTRGFGQVEVKALCDSGLVIVWDAEQGVDYPADPRHLRKNDPRPRRLST